MKKRISPIIGLFLFLSLLKPAFAEWNYWSQGFFSFSVNKIATLLLLPEWRFKENMHNVYLFKLETGLILKINNYFDITPYYVYQEKKLNGIWDRSDIAYLDGTVKISLKNLFDIKISNRLRYQYDFDKATTTLRNTTKISKDIKFNGLALSVFISEEPFYDVKLNRITEHRTVTGINYNLLKNVSTTIGYMINSKKEKTEWTYTNVLVTNLSIKF